MKNMNLKNKKILVVGLGASGLAAAKLALMKGALLWVTEKEDNQCTRKAALELISKNAYIELGNHTEGFVKGKDLIIISPGVQPDSCVMKWAKKYNVPVVSELEFGSWYITCPLICVTGTNGKSTVTSLIDHILRCAGKKSTACGNLGIPLSEVAMFMTKGGRFEKLDFAVVETSSFQLEYIKHFKPYISIWLNFSYDHLDHHESMEDYLNAKLRIFENQAESDWAIIYKDEQNRIGEINAKKIIYSSEDTNSDLSIENNQLKGKHNYENALAASITAIICKVNEDTILKAVKTFNPLGHRTQYVDTIENIDFIDDSKGTNVHAVISALNSFSKPIVLILGGRDKGDDFTRLKHLIKEKVISLVIMGEAKEKIKNQLKNTVRLFESNTLDDAVENAFSNAVPGATVLFSPGCSSFDMFRDYKERGEKFQEIVKTLKKNVFENTKQTVS